MSVMARKSNTKKTVLISMFAALSVALLYVGSIIEVLDISAAVVASLLCIVTVIEYGGGAPWLVYAVTSVLSLVLLPYKMPAFMYAVFFGYYPIIKEKLEKHLKKPVAWVVKELIFNVAIIAITAASRWLFLSEDSPIAFEIAFIALSEVAFVLYDIALTRVVTVYIFKLRKRFKFLK